MEILSIVTLGVCGFVLGWIGRGIHTQHMVAKFHGDMIQHVLDHTEQVICYKMEPGESGELGELGELGQLGQLGQIVQLGQLGQVRKC